jgi:hypothetical protein
VEHGEDAESGADPARVVGEVLESGGGFAQHQVVDDSLVGAGEGPQLGRQGEGDEVVGAGQETAEQTGEPAPGAVAVTLGALTVAAGVVGELEVAALLVAGEERAAEGGCAAGEDVPERPRVRGQHAGTEGPGVCLTGLADDLRQLDHGGERSRSAPLHQAVDGVSCRLADLPGQVRACE